MDHYRVVECLCDLIISLSYLLGVYAGALVDDHDAVLIGQLVDFLSVRVVRGAERIGPQPFDQIEVFDPQHRIPAFTAKLQKS